MELYCIPLDGWLLKSGNTQHDQEVQNPVKSDFSEITHMSKCFPVQADGEKGK